MKRTPFTLLLIAIMLSACTPATPSSASPSPTYNPISPAMQTAAAKATELARATLDPKLFPSPTPPLTATPSADWKLVWAEEFEGADGAGVDPKSWSFDVGGHGWGNNELEYYTDRVENAYLQDGSLVIEARKEEYEGNSYTSARLVTKNKADWMYGRYEIRARLPKGQGIWPAIWMLPSDDTYGGWPRGGEVDIMELIGKDPSTIYGTLHWGAPHELRATSYQLNSPQDFSDDYHIFALEWEPEAFRWYVDGVHFLTVTQWKTSAENAPFRAPFNQRFHLLLNVAVGGNWPGRPDSNTVFPVKMLVDYVRVYER